MHLWISATIKTLNLKINMTSEKIQEKTNIQKILDVIQPFWIGGFSGMVATCVIQPVDMIKTVIQLKS
jgi:hypothetical protein